MIRNAQWIWADVEYEENRYVRFESDIIVDGDAPVIAQISVSGEYALYVNEAFCGFGQFGDWPRKKSFNTHDVTAHCRRGRNSLVLAAWHMGVDSMVSVAGSGSACFCVMQGEKVLCMSDADTLCRIDERYRQGKDVPKVTGQLGFSFEYDACKTLGSQQRAKVCAPPEEIVERPVPNLVTGDCIHGIPCFQGWFRDGDCKAAPSLRMMEAAMAFVPVEKMGEGGVYETQNGDGISLIFDLGRESAGYLDIDAELDEDAVILIGWGEHLKDLRVRTHIDGRNFCAIYRGKAGRNLFFHPFRRMGCRYIQLHVYAKRIKIGHVGLIPVVYPMENRRDILLKDQLHRRIYDTCLDTLELCVHDHYEDCPWREQALYAMDSRIQILCGYYAFGEKRMPRACLELLAGGLRGDGLLEICAPAAAPITIPSFSLAFIVELWEYVLYTADREVSGLADTAKVILDAIGSRRDAVGRLLRWREKRYWNFYEWQPELDGDGPGREDDYAADLPDGLLTAWYAIALDCYIRLLKELGRDASAYEARLFETRRAIEEFWCDDRACYCALIENGRQKVWCELMQALVLLAGACPERRAENLRNRLKSNDDLTPVTLNDALLHYQALIQDEEEYADFVFDDIARVWGNMLMDGATSFWETALGEADFHNAGSLCHGWSAVPVYFYHAYGMGVRPVSPGKMEKFPVYQKVLQ